MYLLLYLYLQTRLVTFSDLRKWQHDDVKDEATHRGKVKCEEKVCLQSVCNNRENYSSNRDKSKSEREPGNSADEEARHSPNLALFRCLKLPAPRMIDSECVVSCANLKKNLGLLVFKNPPSNLREHVQVQGVFSVVIISKFSNVYKSVYFSRGTRRFDSINDIQLGVLLNF